MADHHSLSEVIERSIEILLAHHDSLAPGAIHVDALRAALEIRSGVRRRAGDAVRRVGGGGTVADVVATGTGR